MRINVSIVTMLLILILFLCIWISVPLIILWALNVFGLGIPYTFWTWLATVILLSVLGLPMVRVKYAKK
jgi:hypothetical protein